MIGDCKLQTHTLLILNNQLLKTLDTIIYENQSAVIKKQNNVTYFNNTFNNFTFYCS